MNSIYLERFNSKYKVNNTNGGWEWIAYLKKIHKNYLSDDK